jgi:DnaJ family protein A protein 2
MFFEDFFQGGGMPRGFGGMPGGPQRKGDSTELYKDLGVDQKADSNEIKRQYRLLARKHHPDRGGDPEKFKKIQAAYDVLSDDAKRKAYDATGDPNADPNMMPSGRRKPKGKSTQFELEVPLEQFYTGHTRRIRVTKNIICETCSGKGGQGVTTCPPCRGRGVRVVDRQIGPSMIQRMQMECDRCGGKGQVVPEGSKCMPCRATGIKKETKVLSVEITRGMKHNEKIIFNEEGDQHPDVTPGDVVVILKGQEHPHFTRTPDGCHLYIKKNISLLEALTGFQFTITHLDGRTLLVSSEEGKIYKDQDVKAIKEEGMPVQGGATHGHIYITLNVEMPTRLDAKTKNSLISLLGPVRRRPSLTRALDLKSRMSGDEDTDMDNRSSVVQDVTLEHVDVEAEKRAYKQLLQQNAAQYDDDAEEDDGPQQVGCRAQ